MFSAAWWPVFKSFELSKRGHIVLHTGKIDDDCCKSGYPFRQRRGIVLIEKEFHIANYITSYSSVYLYPREERSFIKKEHIELDIPYRRDQARDEPKASNKGWAGDSSKGRRDSLMARGKLLINDTYSGCPIPEGRLSHILRARGIGFNRNLLWFPLGRMVGCCPDSSHPATSYGL